MTERIETGRWSPGAQRRALVSGAAGGIGQAVVTDLRKRGMSVVGIDLDPQDLPDVLRCDVTDAAAVTEAVSETLRRLGGLDVVVNVVGISGRRWGDGPVHECTEEAWDHVMTTNVRSVFLVCRATLPHLGPGSAVVNLTSVLGMRGGAPGLFETHAYAASKGAIIALTKAMSTSYAARGIRVNAVAPGLVRTPMSERAQENPAVMAHVAARQALLGAPVEAEQVAAAVGWLASPESDAVTGVILPVDGGWTAS
jgi:meso-butanediol dehydrogenase/(S,S)-butanediol dehydrogenase/diacetyl reductase